MRRSSPAVSAAVLILSACAPNGGGDPGSIESTSSPRRCFSVQQVTNFRQGGPGEVYLRVGRNEVYKLSAAGACNDLDFAIRLAILPDSGGAAGSRICTGDWARIVTPGSTSFASVCRVRIDRQLTADEVAALPAAHRP